MAAAFAPDPADANQTLMYAAINEVDQEPVIGSKEPAIPG